MQLGAQFGEAALAAPVQTWGEGGKRLGTPKLCALLFEISDYFHKNSAFFKFYFDKISVFKMFAILTK